GFVFCVSFTYLVLLKRSSIRASSYLMTQFAPVKSSRRAVLIMIIGWLLWSMLWSLAWPWAHWGRVMNSLWVLAVICVFLILIVAIGLAELVRRKEALVAVVFTIGALFTCIEFV